jgi:hypothetical protein
MVYLGHRQNEPEEIRCGGSRPDIVAREYGYLCDTTERKGRMDSEIVGTIVKVIAVAAPAVFVLLLLAVVGCNYWVAAMVRRRKDIEVRLSRLTVDLVRMKRLDMQTREDLTRLLAEIEDGERRATALLAADDLAEEDEDELNDCLAKYGANKADLLRSVPQMEQLECEHIELEDSVRGQEAQYEKLRDEMRELEETYAPIALAINRFMDYMTNGLRVVVTEPKPAHREKPE